MIDLRFRGEIPDGSACSARTGQLVGIVGVFVHEIFDSITRQRFFEGVVRDAVYSAPDPQGPLHVIIEQSGLPARIAPQRADSSSA